MNDPRISQLTLAKPLSGNEFIPLTQRSQFSGELTTVYTSPSAFKDYILGTRADAFCPAGSITAYACPVSTSNIPSGWLLCDGRSVRCVEYGKLFSKIGTTYGGDGVDTFKLPDLRGRLITGYCSTSAVDTFADVAGGNWQGGSVLLGSVGGRFSQKITSSEIPATLTNISIASTMKPSNQSRTKVQTISVTVDIDGSDFFSWRGGTNYLTIDHRNHQLPGAASIYYKTFYQDDNSIIEQGSYSTTSRAGTFSLPFTVLKTENVSISMTGRYNTVVTSMPSINNNYFTQILFDDDPPRSNSTYTCMLQFIQKPDPIPVYPPTIAYAYTSSNTNTLFNVQQPHLIANYIIKY